VPASASTMRLWLAWKKKRLDAPIATEEKAEGRVLRGKGECQLSTEKNWVIKILSFGPRLERVKKKPRENIRCI